MLTTKYERITEALHQSHANEKRFKEMQFAPDDISVHLDNVLLCVSLHSSANAELS